MSEADKNNLPDLASRQDDGHESNVTDMCQSSNL